MRNIKVIKTYSYKIVGIVVENIFRDQNLPRFITLIWVKIPVSTRAEKTYCNFPLTSISFYGSYYDVLLHLIIFLSQYDLNMQQWIIILCFFCSMSFSNLYTEYMIWKTIFLHIQKFRILISCYHAIQLNLCVSLYYRYWN